MMIRMQTKQIVFSGLLLSTLFVAGCGSSVRKEALGGGALTPVTITLLREGGSGDSEAESAESAGPKITEFGMVRGKISVDGSLPQLADVSAKGQAKDAICGEKGIKNESVTGENGGLGNVFIYLKKVPNVDVPPPSTDQIVMDQQGCMFVPHAQVVQVGQPVLLKNSDPIAHNVKLQGGSNSLAETISPNNAANVEYKFQFSDRKPTGVVCDFHTFMSAYVMPVDHPWAAVTNPDGTFEIPNVPAGKVEFVIWHEKLDYIERSYSVDVPENGDAAPIEITVNASKLSS